MHIGVIRENDSENRVSIVPNSVKKLIKAGFEVSIETGAGDRSNHSDSEYENMGAKVVNRNEVVKSNILASIGFPNLEDVPDECVLVCVADPFRNPRRVNLCNDKKVTLLSLDMIPRRISRAQSMDVNSSQDNLAGYRSVILGASMVPKAIPMMTTSAGTVKPSKVVIMGSGVAGLQAIATAKRLGAVVYASDVRKSAAEQIESVGGRFIHVDGMDDFEDDSGYAKPLTPEFINKVNETVCQVASDADLIITTARIFGRPAPITIPESAVSTFKPGAVIVDMNSDVGGNCDATVKNEIIKTEHGVQVIGICNLPGTIPNTASMLFSNNLTTFLTSLVKDGEFNISESDDILVGAPLGTDFHVKGMGGVLVCRDGKIHENQTRLSEVL